MKGKLSDLLTDAVLETLPVDISIIDENDKVIAWNRHEYRLFHRPMQALGRDVRDCHPKKSVHLVERILEDFKSGKKDMARFYINMNLNEGESHKVLIDYFALRGPQGKYLGCMEVSQDVFDIMNLHGEKRLFE